MFNNKEIKFQDVVASNNGLVVSQGTLKQSDLLKAFYGVINMYDLKKSLGMGILKLFKGTSVFFYDTVNDVFKLDCSSDANCLIEDIEIYFNELVSKIGFRFGSHESDAALVGFWKV